MRHWVNKLDFTSHPRKVTPLYVKMFALILGRDLHISSSIMSNGSLCLILSVAFDDYKPPFTNSLILCMVLMCWIYSSTIYFLDVRSIQVDKKERTSYLTLHFKSANRWTVHNEMSIELHCMKCTTRSHIVALGYITMNTSNVVNPSHIHCLVLYTLYSSRTPNVYKSMVSSSPREMCCLLVFE